MKVTHEIKYKFCRLKKDLYRKFLSKRQCKVDKIVLSFVPVLNWLMSYKWGLSFFADLSAGLTMAVFAMPVGIAHAEMSGVAPVYGLYTAIFPSFFYMFFCHSRHNSLGGFAVLSLMTKAAVDKVAHHHFSAVTGSTVPPTTNLSTVDDLENIFQSASEDAKKLVDAAFNETSPFTNNKNESLTINPENKTEYSSRVLSEYNNSANNSLRPIHVATMIVFLSGLLQILMGIFRLDFLSCYLSEQVLGGFVLGGCVHVMCSQFADALGIQLPPNSERRYLYRKTLDVVMRINEAKPSVSIVTACSISFLFFCQWILDPWLNGVFHLPIPYELILVIVGITATNFADLSNRHIIKVVGNIPTGFPKPELPRFELIPLVFFDALGIALTAIAIHLTVIKIVEHRYHYKINNCKEIYSLGFSSLLASSFPVFPITSIFAKTLIGEANRKSTQFSIFFSSLALLSVILYIGPVFEFLPKAILASIIIVSSLSSFSKFKEMLKLWPVFKTDFAIFIASFILTVCYDIAEGLTFTVLFAAATVIIRVQWPKWHFLWHDEESRSFKEISRKKLHTLDDEDQCIIRYDAPLIFANVNNFVHILHRGVLLWKKREKGAPFERDYKDSHEFKSNHKPMTLIIDCSGFSYVDYIGIQTLKKVYCDFVAENISESLKRAFCMTNFFEIVPEENILM